MCDPGHHDEDCDPTTFGVRDADGDGYPDARCCNVSGDEMRCGSDCDDAVGAVHPGEAESCDTFDNDCDGSVDEGVESSYYRDTDGDGYGDGSVAPVMACTAPDSTYVENGTDCDDGERLINPATSELCDELDNNCDGRVDEAGTRNFFRDADEDGYGDPDSIVSLLTCEPPEGYVAIGNDCDDADPDVHPGAPELCNRRDDNCSLPGVGAGGVDPSEDADEDGHARGARRSAAAASRPTTATTRSLPSTLERPTCATGSTTIASAAPTTSPPRRCGAARARRAPLARATTAPTWRWRWTARARSPRARCGAGETRPRDLRRRSASPAPRASCRSTRWRALAR
ncbi:MAG: putative metal-binding motif-containing protein [Sandaracinaceae bacterium]|nr:putative metal-binding motif-containing protein [Sandaracinaceae bacterium]